jgi:ABC-2 type transport system ATP-binding protein
METVLTAEALTKRYGRRYALTDCDLSIPGGRVVGLVGPNGAGKSTLLQLACGLVAPTTGTLRVLGSKPDTSPKIGFVAQDTPVYAGLSVAEHLKLGARLNPGWDPAFAQRRISDLGLDPKQKAGRLSGGQRAQLALTVAAAKRPELLILDEPAAALDPLARDGFLAGLRASITELSASAVLSSHLLGDVERICDYLIILGGSRVQVAGDVGELLATHFRVPAAGASGDVIGVRDGEALVRAAAAPPGATAVGLEELVLAYLGRAGR